MVKRALIASVLLLVIGWIGFRLWRGPDPETILANLERPDSPVLSPEEERGTFRVAPDFRVELVAAEPLVVDPVALDWDDEGRMYVVEMRGYMPDVDATGEDAPVGRVVVLEDTDGDGRMDESRVFLDGLVMPRAIAVLPQGVLIGEQPDLWLCRDEDRDFKCDEKIRLTSYAEGRSNPEHQENALLPGIDNWIYNSRSSRRFRFEGDELQVEPTLMRGQWGLAQDDEGRLFYNHNSGFLYADEIPGNYLTRQPGTATRTNKVGVNVPLSESELVHGVRVAPGLNRAYLTGTLRPDGRQNGPTGVSGLAIQRGHQYGPEFVGDAFVPESAGSTVSRFSIDRTSPELSSKHHLYDDDDWGKREFLASTDERFRPVDAHIGPDGAVYVVDMYRGIIQHAEYVSPHLRAYIRENGLEAPGETGRIWRIVRETLPITRTPPPLDTLDQQVAALSHANGWVRDHAQRRLIYADRPEAATRLRKLRTFDPIGRRHALWTLEGMGALDERTWRTGLADDDPEVRRTALRAGESIAIDPNVKGGALRPLLEDPDPAVRLQAIHSAGSLPQQARPLEWMLDIGRDGSPLTAQAVLSGLTGLELAALRTEATRADRGTVNDTTRAWLSDLAAITLRATDVDPQPERAPSDVLDIVDGVTSPDVKVALLDGLYRSQRSPGSRRIELSEAHPIFDEERERSDDVTQAARKIRTTFTWPGDPRPGGARALTADEDRRRTAGAQLFNDSCAACHGANGRGIEGQAPSLVGSTWVRDSDEWLVRIVLDGLTGPVEIEGKEWNLTMPGHADDGSHFGDEAVSGLLTYVRRAWGHGEDPIAPERVAAIRAERASRKLPWTVAELRELPVEHRLDRYVGIYEVPVVGTQLEIVRQDSVLAIGQPGTGKGQLDEAGGGLFLRDEVSILFESETDGTITGAQASYGGMAFPVSKTK